MRYAIITGTGRSGTNWLLDTLDASPLSHCRNEPHGIRGTPLQAFPLVWTSESAGSREYYRANWDDVAVTTARRCGVRDHNIRYPKPYLHPWSNRLHLSRIMTGPRARRKVAVVDRRLAAPDWELPWWLGSRGHLEDSLGVLKILIDAPLLAWLLDERPDVPVIHIVRHPGGRLNSWLTRLVGPMDERERTELHAGRVARIERIRSFDPDWRAIIPPPTDLSLIELEVWFWRYVNETTMQVGRGHERYRLVRFDDLAADPVGQSEVLYGHVGLTWDSEVRERILADTTRSVFGAVSDSRAVADAWRTELEPDYVETIDKVIAGSPLQDLLT